MNKIVHLSLTNKSVPARFDVVQYATKPAITFVLDDYMPSGTASLYIQKPDGTEIYNACTISGNEVTYQPTTQSFAAAGINKGQLQIIEPSGTAVSFVMFIDVSENIIDSSAIESQDEFTALEQALQSLDGVVMHNDTNGPVSLNGNLTIQKEIPGVYLRNSGQNNTLSKIEAQPINSLGNNLLVQAGGNLIIGGGEYPDNRYSATLTQDTGESTYLGADTNVYIEAGGQTIANAKRWTFDTTGKIISPTNTTVLLGGAQTTKIELWSNATNKIGIAAGNSAENKSYELLAKADRLRLYNETDSATIWDICQNDVLYNGSAPDDVVTTVPNATWTTVGSFQGSLPGIYLILACIRWNSNATGFRKMIITTDPDSTTGLTVQLSDYVQAANGDMTMTNANGTYSIRNVSTKFYVRAYQNSGGNLTAAPRLSLVRLHAL